MSTITIYTDAAHCHVSKIAGWACWIKFGDGHVIERADGMKADVACSATAELMAIANALTIALNNRHTETAVVIRSDCLVAINRIKRKLKTRALNKKSLAHLQAVADMVPAMMPAGVSLTMVHVKAHSKGKDASSQINDAVDKAARNAMRDLRQRKGLGRIARNQPKARKAKKALSQAVAAPASEASVSSPGVQ